MYSVSWHGATLIVGTVGYHTVKKPGEPKKFVTQASGDVIVAFVFSLRQAEQFLDQFTGQLYEPSVREILRRIKIMPWGLGERSFTPDIQIIESLDVAKVIAENHALFALQQKKGGHGLLHIRVDPNTSS
ncbi:MAG: hypothetical protein AAB408_00485 [Patescibacteria group bacterium]